MNNPPTRPLCLELEDAKTEIFSIINLAAKKHNIPFYLLESIVADASRQVSELAKVEREKANQTYKQQLSEFEKREETDDN